MVRLQLFAVVAAFSSLCCAAPAARGACSFELPASRPSSIKRAITPDDLLGLRDIGYPDPLLGGDPSPLALSPDGRQVAFVLNQADAATNGYCRMLVIVPIRPGGKARVIDRGGELITITDVQRGMFVRGGFPALVAPVWSPDGRSIAYLRRDNGLTQVWRAQVDSGGSRQVSRLPSDAEAVAWGDHGRQLVVATRPAKPVIQAAIDQEGRSGWLYDERVVTFSGARPQIRAEQAPLASFVLDPDSGATRPASALDATILGPLAGDGRSGGLSSVAGDGSRASVEPRGLLGLDATLTVRDAAGRATTCPDPVCRSGVIALWWSPDAREVRFLRRQGWNREDTVLYRWRVGKSLPRSVFKTRDALIGCVSARDALICTRENATMPRRLVRIDVRSGASVLLFEPNPEFAAIALGRVERLRWRNDLGLEVWGDLALPPGYRAGRKLPLVVVQYSSRGFLRGGTADEYPIHSFAAHGVAVLSLERPPFVASLDPTITDWKQFARANQKDWADRRSLLSAIEGGVRLAIDRGIADPARIGITGLSDGATTARFALINSTLFSAASISSCCLEPFTVNTAVGIAYAKEIQSVGYPSLIKPDRDFWQPMSIAQNAARINTPLLMQLNDDDGYSMALEAFETLREYGKPVEMYVFPGEYHAKWQPAHRRAIYERNLDWFDFWLRGVESPDQEKADQYRRWRAMRAKRTPATGLIDQLRTRIEPTPLRRTGS